MPRTSSKRTAKTGRIRHIKPRKFDLVKHNDAADNANAILYTPVSRVGMKVIEDCGHGYTRGVGCVTCDENTLVKTMRKLVEVLNQPELRKHVRDGVRLFNYMYNATKAAENGAMPPFKGLELEPVTVTTSSKRGRHAMAVVEIMNTVIMEQLRSKEFLSKINGRAAELK